MLIPAAAIILTRNEERSLPECLASVREFDEVFVVDSHSEDRTVEVALAAGAAVLQFSWDGKYPKKKQWALDHAPCTHDWVLMLDADERPSRELVAEIADFLKAGSDIAPHTGAADICLMYEWQGRLLRHGHRVVKRAFLHRRRCRFPIVDDLGVFNMWEVEGHYQPQTAANVVRFRQRLIHQDRDPLYGWFERHNRYSDWEAHLRASTIDRSVARLRSGAGRLFARMPAKPTLFFLYSYIIRAGFLDGRAGLDYAVAQATYYWQIEAKQREFHRLNASA